MEKLPSAPQLLLLTTAVDTRADGWVMEYVSVLLHPEASVMVTVELPIGTFEIELVESPVDQ